MFHLLYNPAAGVVLVAVCILGYALYRAALPRPLPGIPHHKESANKILGDAPDMMNHIKKHGTMLDWLVMQGAELNSPLYQLFVQPFSKPIVYVTDPREAQDVVLRRAKEFDRSEFFMDLFAGSIPNHHVGQPTNEKFRRGRRLVADTMSNGFLNGVAAPSLHRHALKLMELWRVKNKLSDGHAFRAPEDVNHFALDSIWDTALGSQLNSVGQEIELLQSNPKLSRPASKDEAITFPKPEYSADVRAMEVLMHALDAAFVSPLPRYTHWLYEWTPSFRRAKANKDRLVQESLDDAKHRLLGKDKVQTSEYAGITCATDHLVKREAEVATREGRAPTYDSPWAKDELYGFLIAGYDSSATTLMWALKLIADNPRVQTKMRDVLKAEFPDISGVPSPEQITKLNMPYLDAVIEELTRIAGTAPITIRQATQDTQLLGYSIPKGVNVFFMTAGPGYMAPNDINETIPESVRSVSSRENKARAAPRWDNADVAKFVPERWLKTDNDGREIFDSNAGPSMPFGGGIRGCFGRRLAYLEIRIFLVALIFSFELLPTPGKLGSYDAVDCLTHKPKSCYVLLKDLGKL